LKFKVLLHPKAAKELSKLDANIKTTIKEALKELADDPCRVGKQLKLSNFWSLRIGDYRAIYEINHENLQVIILFIGHRKKVYDDFTKMR
jgi:mRNA interferase RelE/StbE